MTNIVDRILHQLPYNSDDTIVSDDEIKNLMEIFSSHNLQNRIERIEKINNKYLYASFLLKKQEKQDYQVCTLVHCTSERNIPSIGNNNLDWRRVQRGIYGQGVCFSDNIRYAIEHSGRHDDGKRALIVCDVLVSKKEIIGGFNDSLDHPEDDVDTFQSRDGGTYVKFHDFTFYPKYVCYTSVYGRFP